MKGKGTICMAMLLALAIGCEAFADAKNTIVTFSTTADRYADGSSVADGEWYALVWTADGVFEGFNYDGTASDAKDAVLLAAPLAKNGCCPFTVFQCEAQGQHTNGTYLVYLLDTRDKMGRPIADKNAGRPSFVNGAQLVQEAACTFASAVRDWSESGVDASARGFTEAKITSFSVADGQATLTVTGMVAGLKYNLMTGANVDALSSYALDVPKTAEDNAVTFRLKADEARFFRLVREPLVRKEAAQP